MRVQQAYRFALDPTPSQARDLLRHCGAARVAFNWGLARVKANLDQREAERSYGIPEEELTPPPVARGLPQEGAGPAHRAAAVQPVASCRPCS